MDDDSTWYFEELQVIHNLITQEMRRHGASYSDIQLAALFHLGTKVGRLMETAPRTLTPGVVS